jgi:hypothetical protein
MAKSSDANEVKEMWDVGLSENELASIGSIVAHWGAIEHEIFTQTIFTFDESALKNNKLPRAMSNLKFSEVLELWKQRVVDVSSNEHKPVLIEQYEKIVHLSDFRNSLIHGMWDWDIADPKTLITSRVRRKEIINTKFKAGDLEDFATNLAEINLRIRYPGGMAELLEKQIAQRGYYVDHAATRRIRLRQEG